MRVLIADDDPLITTLVAKLVRAHGHEPLTVGDGQAAWEAFDAQPFPLVITDWQMPEMEGETLVRRIRARKKLEYAYIIMLTGTQGAESRAAFQALHVSAPVSIDTTQHLVPACRASAQSSYR